RLVNCFIKCEADRRGTLRGRRQIMLDDSDVHHHRHAKAAVGGVAAAAIGDPAVFVSVDAMHQGPQGGGPVIAIIDAGGERRKERGRGWAGQTPTTRKKNGVEGQPPRTAARRPRRGAHTATAPPTGTKTV